MRRQMMSFETLHTLRKLRSPTGLKPRASGFTIIELLVATLVFSVVLVLIAEGVLQFNHAYYGGITQSNTQNTARSIMENISQAIQFSGDQVTSPIARGGAERGFCIGNNRYSYLLGWELVDGAADSSKHQTNHALVMDTPGNCGGMNAQDFTKSLTASSTELLGPHMRVSKLTVSQVAGTTDLYKIDIRVAYGDDDLLRSPSGGGPTANDVVCQGGSGSQFCATSELSTVVQKRIQ
jgi:prepilin-type N-terminal cleavage/methylation domain-containing protein